MPPGAYGTVNDDKPLISYNTMKPSADAKVSLPPLPSPSQWLRQKGLSGADKKAGRVAAEGAISAYIHPGSRLGVLLEVNCETDFVAASDKFQSLVRTIYSLN